MLKPWHKIWLSGVEFKLEVIKSGWGGGGIQVEPGVFLFFLSVIDDTTKLYQVKSVKIDIFKDEN